MDTARPLDEGEGASGTKALGAQTLMRGIDLICAVAEGNQRLADLSESIGLTRSTTHRLAATLVERRLLNFVPRIGYTLGPKLLELGHLASQQQHLPTICHGALLALAEQTCETVHLGIRDGDQALYLDKVNGSRRIQVSSRIGERQPLRPTGIGKALLLDESEEDLRRIFQHEAKRHAGYRLTEDEWLNRMRAYQALGYTYDLEENEDQIRCVAAPLRGASGKIVGAISISSAAQYMDDQRMLTVGQMVLDTASAISGELGLNEANFRKERGQ